MIFSKPVFRLLFADILLSATTNFLIAQTDTTVFFKTTKVEVQEYVFQVPEKWKDVPFVNAATKDKKFDFTGVGIPATVHQQPLSATFLFRKYECENIKAAENFVLTEFTSYPDRVTPPGANYTRDSLTIASGETAVLYDTRFFRRSKLSNFSRYDMVVYSAKRKAAYMLTVTYQFTDPSYACDTDLHLKNYAQRVFKTLQLR